MPELLPNIILAVNLFIKCLYKENVKFQFNTYHCSFFRQQDSFTSVFLLFLYSHCASDTFKC